MACMRYLDSVVASQSVVDGVVLAVNVFHHPVEPGLLVDAFIDFRVRAEAIHRLDVVLVNVMLCYDAKVRSVYYCELPKMVPRKDLLVRADHHHLLKN